MLAVFDNKSSSDTNDTIDELEAQGVRVPVRLLAATPFVLRFPHTYLNAVDPGRALYVSTRRTTGYPVDRHHQLRQRLGNS